MTILSIVLCVVAITLNLVNLYLWFRTNREQNKVADFLLQTDLDLQGVVDWLREGEPPSHLSDEALDLGADFPKAPRDHAEE